MLKRLAIDLAIVGVITIGFVGIQLLSNLLHYGTFIFWGTKKEDLEYAKNLPSKYKYK